MTGSAHRLLTRARSRTWIFGWALFALMASQSIYAAAPLSLEQRLGMLPQAAAPVEAPVRIFWSDDAVPYIQATRSEDLPFALGVVHAHLRRVQMELLRHVVQGRLAELLGPPVVKLDELLRLLDLDRAVPQMLQAMDPATRKWTQRYVEGVNWQAQHSKERPADARWLGMRFDEPWTVADVLAVGRLASAEVSLARKLGLLGLYQEPAFADYRERLQRFEAKARSSFDPSQSQATLFPLSHLSKIGSNSYVVAPERSASGAALIANDPHLGYLLPNLWVLVGYDAPQGRVVGLSLPGVPAVAVGRNTRLAFGGTNMAAYSHALYRLPSDASLQMREERLKVRGWWDRRVQLPQSEWGPVLSAASALDDLKLPPLALVWRGHAASSELRSFIQASHAPNGKAFRRSFAGYAVAGQNLLYADDQGNIGQIMALEQIPAAARNGALLVEPAAAAQDWEAEHQNALELPAAHNPEQGFLVSANNRPFAQDPPLSATGNQNDRFLRLESQLAQQTKLRVEDLQALQLDVFHASALATSRCLVATLAQQPVSPSTPQLAGSGDAWWQALRDWDGRFAVDSIGASAYFWAVSALLDRYYQPLWGEEIREHFESSLALHSVILEDLQAGRIGMEVLAGSVEQAAQQWQGRPWGELHRLRLQHPLGRIPLVGRRWRIGDFPIPGNNATVWKSASNWSGGRHEVFFGAQARHISDMSDPDHNWFVLLGGQDGWWGSAHFADQVDRFLAGELIQVPLRPATVAARFPHQTWLRPREPQAEGGGAGMP